MRKRLIWLLGLGLLGVSALAASAHFIKASANIDNSGDLIISWKEAGLGSTTGIQYTATANASAVYACINHGGKNPSASNKTGVNAVVTSNGTFNPKNGSVTASLTITPPPPSGFSCPHGQTQVFVSVTYTDPTLTDETNDIPANLTGNCVGSSGCTDVFVKLP